MVASQDVLSNIRQKGFRLTKVRRAVLKALSEKKTPLSAMQVSESLRKLNILVNKTTVYREIEFLHSQGIIREIDLLDGKKRYELLIEDNHHHHAVCNSCNEIQCIEMERDLDALENHIFSEHGFKVLSHALEFFGICKKCQKNRL